MGLGTSFYGSERNYPSNFFINNQLSRGRVEVCRDGQYGSVCNTGWGNPDASVVCRQLGFSLNGKSSKDDISHRILPSHGWVLFHIEKAT